MSKLLVVIDMQVDFVTGALGTREAVEIIPAVQRAISEELGKDTAVVFTKDTHYENYKKTQEGKKLPIEHCIQGTSGWQLIPELRDYEMACPVFEKGTFGSTDLAQYIRKNGFDEIELIGLCTDICIISNALLIKAAVPEATIIVNSNCCAGVTPEGHKNALEAMKICQIEIL